MKKKNIQIMIRVAIVLFVMLSLFYYAYERAELTSSGDIVEKGDEEDDKEKVRIVIDAGHGGGR